MKLVQSLQYGGNVCVLLNFLIGLTVLILAYTLKVIPINETEKIKFVDLDKIGVDVKPFMTKSIIMTSLAFSLILFNFVLIWIIPKKFHAFIGLLLVVAFVISVIIDTVEVLNLNLPDTKETKTLKDGFTYTLYATFGLGGLGCLLLLFSNLGKLYLKK
jgi:hypothetical protein